MDLLNLSLLQFRLQRDPNESFVLHIPHDVDTNVFGTIVNVADVDNVGDVDGGGGDDLTVFSLRVSVVVFVVAVGAGLVEALDVVVNVGIGAIVAIDENLAGSEDFGVTLPSTALECIFKTRCLTGSCFCDMAIPKEHTLF